MNILGCTWVLTSARPSMESPKMPHKSFRSTSIVSWPTILLYVPLDSKNLDFFIQLTWNTFSSVSPTILVGEQVVGGYQVETKQIKELNFKSCELKIAGTSIELTTNWKCAAGPDNRSWVPCWGLAKVINHIFQLICIFCLVVVWR